MFLIDVRLNKYVIKLFCKMVEHQSLFMTYAEIKKCVLKQLMITLMRQNLILNSLRSNWFFVIDSVSDRYETPGMCDRFVSEHSFLKN